MHRFRHKKGRSLWKKLEELNLLALDRRIWANMRERIEAENNCVGFVFSRLGIISDERYVEPPTYKELLKSFDRVDIDKAQLLAVIRHPSGKPYVYHMAILGGDKTTIIHRRGVNSEWFVEDLKEGLESYLLENDFVATEVVYLAKKVQKIEHTHDFSLPRKNLSFGG